MIFLLIYTSLSFASQIDFELMHTVPVCNHPDKKNTWCTNDDRATAAADAGMESRVRDILDEALLTDQGRVTIAFLSFSNSSVFSKLCDIGKKNVPIEGFFDSDAKADSKTYPNRLMNECQGDSGKNVVIHFLGKKEKTETGGLKEWRLHHNKFLIVDSGVPTAKISVNFSSGNLSSSGLSLHFDHWVMTRAPRQSSFVKTHNCVITALKLALNSGIDGIDAAIDNPNVYTNEFKTCTVDAKTISTTGNDWIEKAMVIEEVAPLFSPNKDDAVAKALIDHIDRVVKNGSIHGAIQHFLHQGIAKAMQRAVKRGVNVQLVMDDDVVTGGTDVPGVFEFYNKFLKFSDTGIRVRFIQTNTESRQMMHNKFLVLDGIDTNNETRIFSGAGQFTTSAMKNNYENFYITKNALLTAQYKDLFKYLWKRTINETSAKSGDLSNSDLED